MIIELLRQAGDILAGDHARAVYWAFALAGMIFFAVTGLLHLLGIGAVGDSADVDLDADGEIDIPHSDTGFADFRLLSLRTGAAFVTMFGWGGVVWGRAGWSGFLAALASGIIMMFLTAGVIWLILKMQQNGTIANRELIGKTGSVYLTVEPKRSRIGRVTVNTGSSTLEIRAVTDADTPIGKGMPVRITGYLGGNLFTVVPETQEDK